MPISREDLAKYPFLKEAADYVKSLDLNIQEIASLAYTNIVERSKQRVNDALIYGVVKLTDILETEIEILSFPVAVLFVAKIGDNFLKRRYALAESKRAYEMLIAEEPSKLLEVGGTTFGWKARTKQQIFFLNIIDYLRNSTDFHDNRWKLVNRMVVKGEVLLRREEFVRLLQEEVRKHIENIIENSPNVELNTSLLKIIEEINQNLTKQRKEFQTEALPKEAVSSAYPPCIKRLYEFLLTAQHLSHMGRFTLTSFLLKVGVAANELMKLYISTSDFDEKLTRYQVEHIAGKKGSRVKYNPPSCHTLKTHGLCPNSDDICKQVSHPLSYYEQKLRLINLLADKNE